jgi:hypothetical protein
MCQVYQESHDHECPSCRKDFEVEYDEDASEKRKQAAHPDECPHCGIELVWDHDSHVAFPKNQMPIKEEVKQA